MIRSVMDRNRANDRATSSERTSALTAVQPATGWFASAGTPLPVVVSPAPPRDVAGMVVASLDRWRAVLSDSPVGLQVVLCPALSEGERHMMVEGGWPWGTAVDH